MKKFLLLTAAVLGFMATAATANATPITLTSYTVWSADTPGANSGSTTQQGLPSAAAGLGAAIGSGSITGVMNFNDVAGNTIGGFFASDSPAAVITGCSASCLATTLSSGNFAHVSLFKFTFTLPVAVTGFITHDDGISIFVSGDTLTNLIPGNSSPTTPTPTAISLAAGTYDLWYSAANGLPEVLQSNVTPVAGPEPATVALLGAGLVGVGAIRRRRKAKTRS